MQVDINERKITFYSEDNDKYISLKMRELNKRFGINLDFRDNRFYGDLDCGDCEHGVEYDVQESLSIDQDYSENLGDNNSSFYDNPPVIYNVLTIDGVNFKDIKSLITHPYVEAAIVLYGETDVIKRIQKKGFSDFIRKLNAEKESEETGWPKYKREESPKNLVELLK